MDIMLVGGMSPILRRLSEKLHKEGHRVYLLSGSRDLSVRYEHIFERYDFPYTAAAVEEVFCSVNPDVTVLLGAFDGGFYEKETKQTAVEYIAGLQNVLLSWVALNKGRLIYLSSVEVYGNSFSVPGSEEVRPVPGGTWATALLQIEESCALYRERLNRDTVVLRLDRLCYVPKDKYEAERGLCESKCLSAFRDGTVTYRRNRHYGLTFVGDAVETIYKLIACERHDYGLYNLSSGAACSEEQIVDVLDKLFDGKLEKIDNTLEDRDYVVLSNARIREEFGFSVKFTLEEILQNTLRYMEKHRGRFLDSAHPGRGRWRRMYYRLRAFFGATIPYIENLLLFIPFFMLNNRATESAYFSKIDLYLLYVLLFAVVHGQRQATFSAVLATGGYIFRQMYGKAGIAVVTDYNTYVWVAEIFIMGLVVGYMKDRLNALKEEKEQEEAFLSEQVADITDINDSNLRVKEGLITQVVNYNYSLGTVYDMIERLGEDHPVNILFRALSMVRSVTDCADVSLYLLDEAQNARLFGRTSQKAASLGSMFRLSDCAPLADAVDKGIVYLNRTMESAYPMMAYCVAGREKPDLLLMLWSLPFERMTIDESNRLIVLGRLMQTSARRAKERLVLEDRIGSANGKTAWNAEAFGALAEAYFEAEKNNLAEYSLLAVDSVEAADAEAAVSSALAAGEYFGRGKDGTLYILLASTGKDACTARRQSLAERGIQTVFGRGGTL